MHHHDREFTNFRTIKGLGIGLWFVVSLEKAITIIITWVKMGVDRFDMSLWDIVFHLKNAITLTINYVLLLKILMLGPKKIYAISNMEDAYFIIGQLNLIKRLNRALVIPLGQLQAA